MDCKAPTQSGPAGASAELLGNSRGSVSSVTAWCESRCYQEKGGRLIGEAKARARRNRLRIVLQHCLSFSAALAGIASAAVYVLAYFLFTIHEEIGIPADAALPLALWTSPVVFLLSIISYLVWKAGPGTR